MPGGNTGLSTCEILLTTGNKELNIQNSYFQQDICTNTFRETYLTGELHSEKTIKLLEQCIEFLCVAFHVYFVRLLTTNHKHKSFFFLNFK